MAKKMGMELSLKTLETRLQEVQEKREKSRQKYDDQEQRIKLQMKGVELGKKTAGGIRRLEVSCAMVLYRYAKEHMPKVYANIVAEADRAGYITRPDIRKFAGLPSLVSSESKGSDTAEKSFRTVVDASRTSQSDTAFTRSSKMMNSSQAIVEASWMLRDDEHMERSKPIVESP
jgi:hypothetical protein